MVLFSQSSLVALAKVSQIINGLSTDAEQIGKQLTDAGYQGIPGNWSDDPLTNSLRDRGLNVFSIERISTDDGKECVAASIVIDGKESMVEMPRAVVEFWVNFHSGAWPGLVRTAFRETHVAQVVTMSVTPVTARYVSREETAAEAAEAACCGSPSGCAKALPTETAEKSVAEQAAPAKRGRGRPRKHPAKIVRT